MTDLRKAAEQALEALERLDRWLALRYGSELTPPEQEVVKALRQALAEDALKTVADIDHSLGLFVDSPKEWVGFTDGEKKYLKALGYVGIDDIEDRLKRMNAMSDTTPPKRKTLAELLDSTPIEEKNT